MNRLAVYGSGAAARAVTQLLCENGFAVNLISPGGVSKMESAIFAAFEKSAREKMKQAFLFPDDLKYEVAYVEQRMSQLRFGDNLWALSEAPAILFEIFDDADDASTVAIVEKRRAVRDARVACPDAVIASHSECLRFGEIFADLECDHRLIGTHFVHPIGHSKVIEIVPTKSTSESTLMMMKSLAGELKMNAVLCRDQAGLIANRLVANFCREKTAILDNQAITAQTLDTVFRSAFGSGASLQQLEDSIGTEIIRKLNGAV